MNEENNNVEKNQNGTNIPQEVQPVTPQENANEIEELMPEKEPPVQAAAPQQVVSQPTQQTVAAKGSSNPQVVKVTNTKEVVKEVPSQKTTQTVQNTSENSVATTPPPTQVTVEKKGKKGHPIFLILLILFLGVFVFFLPNIQKFVQDYLDKGKGDGSLKSGSMTCSLTQNFQNGSNMVDVTLKYKENKLKSTSTTSTYRLADTATDNETLKEHQEACEKLKNTLSEVKGMDASCSSTATIQKTIQDVDYQSLDLTYLKDNIAEFEGYMPEYELDQSVEAIKSSLEQSGYSCKATEY